MLKRLLLVLPILICSCATKNVCSDFKKDLASDIRQLDLYCHDNVFFLCDNVSDNLTTLLGSCPTQIESMGKNNSQIIHARKLLAEYSDTKIRLEELKIKKKKDFEESELKKKKDFEESELKLRLEVDKCNEEFSKIKAKSNNVESLFRKQISIVDNTGLKIPSSYLTASVYAVIPPVNACQIVDNVIFKYYLSLERNTAGTSIISDNTLPIFLNDSPLIKEKEDSYLLGTYSVNQLATLLIKPQPLNIYIENVNISIVDRLPKYNHSDKNINVDFDGRSISIKNMSSKFLTISEVWFYYNNNITKIRLDNISMPPESIKKNINLSISDETRVNMLFSHVTKKEALKTKLKIGYAVNYRIGNNSVETTFYEIDTYSLADII